MYKLFVLTLILVAVGSPVFGETVEVGGQPKKQGSSVKVHGEGSTKAIKVGLVDVLKKLKLANYASSTIGDAFNNYKFFARKEWQETHVKGKTYIDFTGWFKSDHFNISSIREGISLEGLGVKFIISPDGDYGVVMVSRVVAKTDGMLYSYPQTDISGILDKIYANREIRF
jgi:hypothetical protein